ncbi:MAG: protease modulator HflC [Thermodesulfobacteriota bacterium]
MNAKHVAAAIIVVAVLVAAYSAIYVVDEREQVVVTQLGAVKGPAVTEPGLHFLIPFIQTAHFLPKNLLQWDGEPGEIPTAEKTLIWVDTFARWRIYDPIVFWQSTGTVENALLRVTEIIDPAVRNAIASYPLIETIRTTNRSMEILDEDVKEVREAEPQAQVRVGRRQVMGQIKQAADASLKGFGIELVDVKIKRINYRKDVRDSVYGRMIAERNQIAEKYRSEGKGEASKIRGDMEKELKRIQSEAYWKAQEKMGKADAEAASVYAEAYGRDPDFYDFTRSMDLFRDSLNKDTTLILSTDSDLFQYFKTNKPR